MEFSEWEVDNSVWAEMAEESKLQDSVPRQRAQMLANAEDTTATTTEGGAAVRVETVNMMQMMICRDCDSQELVRRLRNLPMRRCSCWLMPRMASTT